jgi:hypothetical protein
MCRRSVLRYTGPEVEATPLGIVEQVPCDHPEPCGFKHWERLQPHKPGDSVKTSDGTLFYSKDGETFKPLGAITDVEYHAHTGAADRALWASLKPTFCGLDLAHRTRWERIKDWFRQPKWKKKPGQITTDSMGNDWLNVGKFNVQARAHNVKLSPAFIRELEKYPVQESGASTEREQPISTLTFWHRITIMVVAFQMLRINKQPFNWRSIPELVRYLRKGKLPGMDKPFKAETLKAFGVPAEKFAQGGVVAPSKNYYLVGEDSQGQEYKLGQDAIKSAIASFENFGKTVERTGASLSDFHKAANLIKHVSECEFQPKSAEHDQIDCTCQPRRARAELWTRILTAYWGFPILWNAGLWNIERRTWAMIFNYVFRRIIPAPNPQSEHTIENSNPTQNARNKQHHQPTHTPSERYAIIYLCIIAALWLLSLIVGIVFNWPAHR